MVPFVIVVLFTAAVDFYRVETKPVVMILDAETKTKLKEWTGFIEPDLLLDRVTAFVGATYPVLLRTSQPATLPAQQYPAELVPAVQRSWTLPRGRRNSV